MATTAEPPPSQPRAASLRDSAKLVGWGLLFWGAIQFAASVFSRNATAAAAVQAGLAEWGAGRMGIPWSDPLAPIPSWQSVARRAGLGAAAGAAAAALVVALALAARSGRVAEAGFAPGLLGVGLVIALLSAVRDELLLRGVVLRVTRGLVPWWAGLVACGACAAGARYGVDGVVGVALLVEALRGLALGALWTGDRGAWMAVGANTAWSWALGSVARGGLLDVRFSGDAEATPAAVLVGIACAGAAVVWARRAHGSSPRTATPLR